MKSITLPSSRELLKSSLIDVIGIAFIYLVPSISHLLSLPLYLLEPMRIVVLISLAHSRGWNSYLLAFSLPLFSFVVASHPVFLKSLLIAIELVFNVWLFYRISKVIRFQSIAVLASVFISKLLYYSLKFVFISFAFLDSELVSTPLYIQAIMLGVFVVYFLGLDFSPRKR